MKQNTTLLLILVALIVFVMGLGSCSKNNYPNGCKPEKQRKQIKFKGFMSSVDSPRNVQCKVFEIMRQDKKRVECKAMTRDGHVINIRYGFAGWFKTNEQRVKIGMWITIQSFWDDKQEEWLPRIIHLQES